MKSVFANLRKGQRIRDRWYGTGKVIKVTTRHAYIELHSPPGWHRRGEAWKYDRSHINMFVTIERKK